MPRRPPPAGHLAVPRQPRPRQSQIIFLERIAPRHRRRPPHRAPWSSPPPDRT